jgi:fatty acid desaturase
MTTPSSDTLDRLAVALDQLKAEVRADLGERDVTYIHRMIRLQRSLEVAGRLLLHVSMTPVGFLLGSSSLAVSKILENMEIGHNVMHGQYDWMNDPSIHSSRYEWDTACDAQSWKRTHNHEHHAYTNILGKDRDYGYGLMRLDDRIPWEPHYRFQLVYYYLLSSLFQWGVALHELEIEKLRSGELTLADKKDFGREFLRKAGKQIFKDYVFFPALAGGMFWKVAAGNALANVTRNFWASTVIFCGHFTGDAEAFTEAECANETRGHWYYRQLRGSSNFEGNALLHVMSGHLSHQIEHHLFPDIPAHRYPDISVRVRAICQELDIPYNTGSFWNQYKTVVKRIWRYSRPTHGTTPAVRPVPDTPAPLRVEDRHLPVAITV